MMIFIIKSQLKIQKQENHMTVQLKKMKMESSLHGVVIKFISIIGLKHP